MWPCKIQKYSQPNHPKFLSLFLKYITARKLLLHWKSTSYCIFPGGKWHFSLCVGGQSYHNKTSSTSLIARSLIWPSALQPTFFIMIKNRQCWLYCVHTYYNKRNLLGKCSRSKTNALKELDVKPPYIPPASSEEVCRVVTKLFCKSITARPLS